MIPQLTFDDGPSEWTPAILDLLAEHKQQAAFFVLGEHALWRDERLQRMHAEGHLIGAHGYSHKRLTDLPDSGVRGELRATIALVESATAERPQLFRAPFFGTDERVNRIARKLGLTHCGADIIPDDWAASDPEAVARVVLSELRPGKVVSLHDGIPPGGGSEMCTASREVTVAALRLILQGMRVAA